MILNELLKCGQVKQVGDRYIYGDYEVIGVDD